MKKITTTKRGDVKRIEIPESLIAARAYERFIERGREHGHDLEDWLEAEREIAEEARRRSDPASIHLAG